MTNDQANELTKKVLAQDEPLLREEVFKRLKNPAFVSSNAVFQTLKDMPKSEANKFCLQPIKA